MPPKWQTPLNAPNKPNQNNVASSLAFPNPMIATKAMRRPTIDDGDSDSVSSDEGSGKRGEFLSRASQIITGLGASQIITGLGRGVNLLNIHQVEEGPRNDLHQRFLEAKLNNLFDGRGSNVFSEASGIDEESISDASTFDMPKVRGDDDGVSCDDTGGVEPNDLEADIDRLQLEIQAPCAHIQTQEKHVERSLSGVTLDSVKSNESSRVKTKTVDQPTDAKTSRLASFPFFGKNIRGDSNRSSNKSGDSSSELKHLTTGVSSRSERSQSWRFMQPVDSGHSRKKASARSKSGNWVPGASFLHTIEKEEAEQNEKDTAKAHEKSKAAAKLMHNHFQIANNPESFRQLKLKMKAKGAVTGTSVRALLQNTELGSLSSSEKSEDSIGIELEPSVKDNFFISSGSRTASQRTMLSQEESDSEAQYIKQQELQQRLRRDPLFGDMESRPYIHLPSREPSLQFLTNVILCSSDEGKTSLLTLHGGKYLGKSTLINAVIQKCQECTQSSFTIMQSERSDTTNMMSFYPFRQIISTALRVCDERTQMLGEQSADDANENLVRESDSVIVQRLIERKVLDKLDQLMISRILPDVMIESRNLLSLLEGRSPSAITKDTAATLFKLLIPLQPVILVFDAAGEGGFDGSSWNLLEQLILSSHTSCPQIIPILISRQSLTIPKPLLDVQVDVEISAITKRDAEEYIRTIFDPGCVDKDMVVDANVLDILYARAHGCPLFLERLVLWAQRREILEIDETRNAVAINNIDRRQSQLTDVLPTTLYEEVLSEINKLSHNDLDSLKLAYCMGMIFSPTTYEALVADGLFETLQALMKSHRIFCLNHEGWFKWRFSVVFDAVSSIIITDERQELHEGICEGFSRTASTVCDVQRARHYSITHRLNEAWDLLMDAGKQCEKIFDFIGAVALYKMAKCSRRKRSALREKIACSTALGWSLQALERHDEAEKELESSLEWTMSLPENDRHEEYSLLTALAKVKAYRSKYREAIELYERALPIVDTNAHSAKWLAHHISAYGEILRKVIIM